MSERPRISLSIPTYNRVDLLKGALESALREISDLPPGTAELIVCDNASTDGTSDYMAQCLEKNPSIRYFRNPQNLGFDLNYLRCVEEAKGEFVWVMGDDDLWRPGSIARVLRELNEGAEACLCQSMACDHDMNPIKVLPWYLDEDPPRVWNLRSRGDLIRYFDACARNAAVFAFISVGIIPRDRFMSHKETYLRITRLDFSSIHILGMMHCFRESIRLHYIPDVLVENRLTSSSGDLDLYGRWMADLRVWPEIADEVFGNDPDVNAAFCKIVGRNHHDTVLPGLRLNAGTEERWAATHPYLIRAGFTPVMIAAVDLSYQYLYGNRLPSPVLKPAVLCLADLALIARGARRIAILALGGLPDILEGAALLSALRRDGRQESIHIFCPAECAELLDGFTVHDMDAGRYGRDIAYRESAARTIMELSPEFAVNLDRSRGIESDDLVAAAHPVASVAFELPDSSSNEKRIRMMKTYYQHLVPVLGQFDDVFAVLGFDPCAPDLWPASDCLEEAHHLFENLGWAEETTVAVLLDDASPLHDPHFQTTFQRAAEQGCTFLGLGGPTEYAPLEKLLEPWEGKAVNLAGSLSLGSMAAVLQKCSRFVGGTPLFQAVAKACGCEPHP